MGVTVVFWSPVPGQAGTTTNLLAAATCMGLEHSARLLLLGHLQNSYAAVERAYFRPAAWHDIHAPDTGIDALLRLLKNRKLEPAMLRDYAHPLLRDRLDILHGSIKQEDAFIEMAKEWLTPLLAVARRAYDIVLLDGGSGSGSAWNELLRQQADVGVICLPQNRLLLERFFQSAEASTLQDRRTLLAFGQYDPYSTLTVKNLMRQFRIGTSVYPVSHNTGWMDAVQHGESNAFWFRNRKTVSGHENHLFVQQVRRLAQAVIDSAGARQSLFGGRVGDTP
ncbi:hypothetical protein BG53_07765 [Paenibacillus darwinianus]|uniref:Cellulose biosynthesis protein BcsQ n=1 Tax=Paenibacillus darwinianus TaxID=1380763 RepID=A0A9W5W6I1_9BACL|nr:hypothetical protein [Paenibacillus darwinianus]EXX85703.1 hypothetical protein BG53_07765 [Paenibacillus darwinianus]EXX87033.1 hypothetical protein BG52_05165 [Paenibacillus darwinianus]EXX88934.1 hypothetical protein CH50_02440 [Paenibacillus darwinianus]